MSDAILNLLKHLATEVPKHAAELSELDSRIGDGDLGSTIQLGFKSMSETLPGLCGRSPGEQLAAAGMAFNSGGASTFGALIATALMRAGRAADGKNVLAPLDITALGRAALEGMMKRGKAKLGDKTLLDALAPAIDAYESAMASGATAAEAVKNAADAAEAAVQRTTSMQSKVSRAGWLAEKSVGVPDPGAVAVVHMLRASLAWLQAPPIFKPR